MWDKLILLRFLFLGTRVINMYVCMYNCSGVRSAINVELYGQNYHSDHSPNGHFTHSHRHIL